MTLPRFSVEIDARELSFILHGLAEHRARLQVEGRRLKGAAKAELECKLEIVRKRYDEMDLLMDKHMLTTC